MVSADATADAVRRAHSLPSLRIGLHLVLVEGTPTLTADRIPGLVDRSGWLRSDLARLGLDIACRPSVRRQLRAEITAQFEAYRTTGLMLDHVNAHKHFHLHPVVASEIIAVGRRFGMRAMRVPAEPGAVLARIENGRRNASWHGLKPWAALLRARARQAGLVTPDAVFGLTWSGAMTRERVLGLIGNLPAGLIEIYTHPAVTDRFPGHAEGYRYACELDALCAPATSAALRDSDFCLGSYADVFGSGTRKPDSQNQRIASRRPSE